MAKGSCGGMHNGRQGKTEANSPKRARAGAYQAEQQLPSERIYPDPPRSVGGDMGELQRQWHSSPTCQGILVKMLCLGIVVHRHAPSYSRAPATTSVLTF